MHKKNILVVDEDELVHYALKKALQTEDVLVTPAATAAEAVLKITSSRMYDLCLLNIRLPDCCGLTLMQIIREICSDVKIIVMAPGCIDDLDMGRQIRKAISRGACRFITTPFNLRVLQDSVAQALYPENGVHAGLRFSGNRLYAHKKERRRVRTPFEEEFRYSISVIKDGKQCRLLLLARAIDVSEDGVGFLTQYPLLTSQVLSFENEIPGKSRAVGRVVWSAMIDEGTCRAGVCFA